MKKFVAVVRVSSREQEREGFSLDVQEQALHKLAQKHNGEIEKLFRIAETATIREERTKFREALTYTRRNAERLDGIMFYKVDRAARNMADWHEIDQLHAEYGVDVMFPDLPTCDNPNGKLVIRTLAAVAAYQTDRQSLDVREGLAKRVEEGYFPSHAPYGYRNVRGADGRSRVEIDERQARVVQRAFHLRAAEHIAVEQIVERLHADGHLYCNSKPRFPLSTMHRILQDRSYIGDIHFHAEWHPGTHPPLVDRQTWNNVQASLGQRRQKSHKLLFSNGLVRCGHCTRPVTGESKVKKTKHGPKDYVYYRCSRYTEPSHPRQRIKENKLEAQAVQALSALHFPSEEWRAWATSVANAYFSFTLSESSTQLKELQRQKSRVSSQLDELLNLRIAGQIPDQQFQSKQGELQQRDANLAERIRVVEESSHQVEQRAHAAGLVFDMVRQQWPGWDVDTKHLVLRLIFGRFELQGDKLVQVQRTPIELFKQSPL